MTDDAGDYKLIDEAKLTPEDSFLTIVRRRYQYRKAAGDMSPVEIRDVMARPDAGAIVLFEEASESVVLVRQFRVATVQGEIPGRGWILEIPAGIIEPDETPMVCAKREALEETGYAAGQECRHIATVFTSPGGCTERIFIYFAKTDPSQPRKTQYGTAGEDVQPVCVTLDELEDMLARGDIQDAKTLIAAQWLRQNRPGRKLEDKLEPQTYEYKFSADVDAKIEPARLIGIKTGEIDDIRGVDAWVNAENTDMMMARIFEKTISARIRYLGAAKNLDNSIHADTIDNALQHALAGQAGVKAGSVLVTTSGELRRTHKVKCIMHVACADHVPKGAINANPDAAAFGLGNVLIEADNRNMFPWRHWGRHSPLRSILVPLIGAGTGRADKDEVARKLVSAAFKHLEVGRASKKLRAIYFTAYNGLDLRALQKALKPYIEQQKLREPEA